MEGNRSRGRGAVRSGLQTGLSTAAVSGSAAVLGVILSRKFGHGVKTDGFFAAYGVYLALVLVAGSLRVVVLPRFVAARAAGRLAGEVGTWAVGLAPPLAAVARARARVAARRSPASLTSNASARDQAALLLPWIVPSAVAQIYGGLVASALAALDDYRWAALGFASGSVAGVVLTLALVGHGVVAFGWGLALNGALSLAIPLVPLLARGGVGRPGRARVGAAARARRGRRAARRAAGPLPRRLPVRVGARCRPRDDVLVRVPDRCIPRLGHRGVGGSRRDGAVRARGLVAASASPGTSSRSPGCRSPSSRAAAGVFALAGETVVRRVLGSSYGGGTGAELGRLVVYLVPWMVASVARHGRVPARLRARPCAVAARCSPARRCSRRCSSSGRDAPPSGSPASPSGSA